MKLETLFTAFVLTVTLTSFGAIAKQSQGFKLGLEKHLTGGVSKSMVNRSPAVVSKIKRG